MVVKASEYVSDGIREAAQRLSDDLRVYPAPDQKSFHLTSKSQYGELRVQSVFLRRETTHCCTDYPDILLHISEVQDLNIWLSKAPEGPREGSLTSQQLTVGYGGKVWWEVSLSSVVVNEVFQTNDTLVLGNSAEWAPDSIIETDTMKRLFNMTQDLVTRIDSVGYYNRARKGVTVTKASERERKSEVFW